MEGNSNHDTETYTAKEVAQRLKMSERNVYRLRDAGKIPQPIKLGRSIRWPVSVIKDFLEQQSKQANG